MTSPLQLCPSAQLIASTLSESNEACFLLNAEGIVLYENPAAKRLIFETTDKQYDRGAGDPKHSYHFSFFFTFTSTDQSKTWQEYLDELMAATSTSTQSPHRRFSVTDESIHREFPNVQCQKSNGASFPANVRLSKIGSVFSENNNNDNKTPVTYLCAHVTPKIGVETNNPFEKDALRCILNAAFHPMFSIDEKGIILMANRAAEETFGWSFDEFVGSNIKMICGGSHSEKHDGYIQRYLQTGEKRIIGRQREVPARRRDGTEFPAELGVKEVSCLEYGVQGQVVFCAFLKDLTQEKKHRAELQHNIELMQGMINASFDPMININSKGIIQTVNNATVALFGYRRDELIGHNISMLCGAEHAEKHDSYLQHYFKTGQKRVIGRKRQVTARRKDGKEFEIELGVQEVESPVTGERLFCGFIRDLTRHHMEKRRMRKQEQTMKSHFFGTNEEGGSMKDHATTM